MSNVDTHMSEKNMIKRNDEGNIRLLIVGNSGSGKSTLADDLAKISNFPVLHLDEAFWRPDWKKTPKEEFANLVRQFILKNPNWILDGDYRSAVGNITQSAATNIIWLDPPFWLYFPRLVWRTFLRLLGSRRPCSLGCEESLRNILTFGKKSIIWWCWTAHEPVRKNFAADMSEDTDGKWIRLSGWGYPVKRFVALFEKLWRQG